MNSINNILNKWLTDLNNFSFKEYDQLPDIDLYMEQVVTFLEKQLQIFQTSSLDKQITPSMINNYVKGEVITAPISKKYNREHLALIQEVCTLKQVLTLSEIKQIVDYSYRLEDSSNDVVFNKFNELLNEKNHKAIETSKTLLDNVEENDLANLNNVALELALTANAYINISKRILFLTRLYDENVKNKEKTE